MEIIREQLSFLSKPLVEEIISTSKVVDFAKGQELLRDQQYVKVIPIVIKGLVKVFSKFEDKELLLYYIQPKQSCIMSFSATLQNTPSKIFAITEEDSKIILIPSDKLTSWLKKYPDLNNLFYQQYDLRYSELLDTIKHALFNTLDIRLYEYLKHKSSLSKGNAIKITHGQIASELGTAREVISRVIKKLEFEGKINKGVKGITLSSE